MPTAREVADALLESTVVGSFTRLGIRARRRLFHWEDLDAIPMDGRVVLVTGVTSGLGRAAAVRLARMGASLRIVGRDQERTSRAREQIVAASGRRDVGQYLADVGDLAAVRALVADVLRREERLDVVVHNAGAMVPERRESVEGHELSFATMVLGPYAMTIGLLPLLRRTGGARVVFVSSGGMYSQRLHTEDLEYRDGAYRPSVAYARAKRAQVALTEAWGRRAADLGVVVHAMHPGWAATPGVHDALPRFERVIGPLLRSAEEGADTMVWLAAADEPGRLSGCFWHDRRPRRTAWLPGTATSPADGDRLLAELARLAAPT
jgi:NAD(P)-dependent dehydrogenase (short-subunit alcohol dehydrogenase family)